MINTGQLKDAERVVRITMVIILLTAGVSKLFSAGGFYDYYSALFQSDLRINLPAVLVNLFLKAVPYLEIGLGLTLLITPVRKYAVYGWFGFMWILLFGHYILQEWSSVNQMLGYIFLGLLCLILPTHASWLRRDATSH